jgi:hypothetical protein
MPDMPAIGSLANWTWYASHFLDQLGVAGFLLLLSGAVAIALRWTSAGSGILKLQATVVTATAVSAWLMFSLISNKEPRFGLPILPLGLIAAALWIGHLQQSSRIVLIWLPALGALAILEAVVEDRWNRVPQVVGHVEAATIASVLAPQNSRILISAHRDGNFIFALREAGSRPDLVVRRADKLLVEMRIMRQLGIKDRGLSALDVRSLLERENISVVVAQTGYLADQASMRALQAVLADGCCFTHVKTVEITGKRRSDETELRVYLRK